MSKAEIGTLIHGTMRLGDLIPAFLDELKRLDPTSWIFGQWEHEIRDIENEWIERDPENAEYLLEALFDALNEHAPPYCYFGAHEGDGSDYGFWPSWDAIEDAVHDGELFKVAAGDPWSCVPEIIEVNDHGNVTLYIWDAVGGRHVEAWGIV